MKAYIHHPYSITHIGIGSWLGPYVVFMVTDHVPSYESIHPSSILHHAYWHWAMAWVICFFLLTDYVLTYLDHPYSITHIILYIYIGSWLGSYVVIMVTYHVPSYESIHPSSTINHAYWYWVLVWVICCFNGDRSCTVI